MSQQLINMKKKPIKKKPIKITNVPTDVNLQAHKTLEEENEQLTKKVKILQQQNLELIQEIESIKADFDRISMR